MSRRFEDEHCGATADEVVDGLNEENADMGQRLEKLEKAQRTIKAQLHTLLEQHQKRLDAARFEGKARSRFWLAQRRGWVDALEAALQIVERALPDGSGNG